MKILWLSCKEPTNDSYIWCKTPEDTKEEIYSVENIIAHNCRTANFYPEDEDIKFVIYDDMNISELSKDDILKWHNCLEWISDRDYKIIFTSETNNDSDVKHMSAYYILSKQNHIGQTLYYYGINYQKIEWTIEFHNAHRYKTIMEAYDKILNLASGGHDINNIKINKVLITISNVEKPI